MPFEDLSFLLKIGLLVWLAAMGALFVTQCRRSGFSIGGLFSQTAQGAKSGEKMKSRLQHVLTVLFVAFAYAATAVHEAATADGPLKSLPDISENLVVLLGGSSIGYVSVKAMVGMKKAQGGK